jgi:hypothetical protein
LIRADDRIVTHQGSENDVVTARQSSCLAAFSGEAPWPASSSGDWIAARIRKPIEPNDVVTARQSSCLAGDGRRLERTITGNSAHYVLDSRGRVVDALPGLYSPQAFLRGLQRAAELAGELDKRDAKQHASIVAIYHRQAADRLDRDLPPKPAPAAAATGPGIFSADLDIPFPKTSSEGRVIRAFTTAALPDLPAPSGYRTSAAGRKTEASLELATLQLLAAKARDEIVLSDTALGRIHAQIATIPSQYLPGPPADVAARAIRTLLWGIACDTARSEYEFHRQIHQWLADDPNVDVDRLNERVYSELFQAPQGDPWMGLLDVETFSAIDAAGIVVPRQ